MTNRDALLAKYLVSSEHNTFRCKTLTVSAASVDRPERMKGEKFSLLNIIMKINLYILVWMVSAFIMHKYRLPTLEAPLRSADIGQLVHDKYSFINDLNSVLAHMKHIII